ncbi:uncharacterized protein LOC109706809 isoform X2 [Ananas comosus]|uniref:Uncharacterized protein LOC109706809 isoform X2 n=1 Tax=Ananas comosus TaxID=4615 RepID=A0A6P5EQ28_ANACO|nr:uncharacterized protein LOC109706809 isoform X2 [Ananas comosus]
MGDVLVLGAERRAALQSGAFALPPPPDSLLGRLEQIDHRLEEKQRVPVPLPEAQSNNYFIAELVQERPAAGGEGAERRHQHHQHQHHQHHHHHSKSMPSAFPHHQLHLKGTLTDRLHLLESRIRQLSFELDKGGSMSTAAAGSTSREHANSCVLPAVFVQAEQQQQHQQQQQQEQEPVCSGGGRVIGGGTWKTGRIFQRSARELHAHKPKSKAKDPKEAMSGTAEKRASAMYRSEKRRSERTRLYRRWFRVGC